MLIYRHDLVSETIEIIDALSHQELVQHAPSSMILDVVSKRGSLEYNKTGVPYFQWDKNQLNENTTIVTTPATTGFAWNTEEVVKTTTLAKWGTIAITPEIVVKLINDTLFSLGQCYSDIKSYEDFYMQPEIMNTVNKYLETISKRSDCEKIFATIICWAEQQYIHSVSKHFGMLNLIGYIYDHYLNKKGMSIPFYAAAAEKGDFIAMSNLQQLDSDPLLNFYWIERIKSTSPGFFAQRYHGVNPFTYVFADAADYATKYYQKLGLRSF